MFKIFRNIIVRRNQINLYMLTKIHNYSYHVETLQYEILYIQHGKF